MMGPKHQAFLLTFIMQDVLTLIIEPVTEAISLIAGKGKGQFPWSNSFLIQGKKTALIDSGCGIENLQAVHTPGHTADHYCFFEPEERILFSFDLDLSPFGPWYGHRESDLSQLRNSIHRIRE